MIMKVSVASILRDIEADALSALGTTYERLRERALDDDDCTSDEWDAWGVCVNIRELLNTVHLDDIIVDVDVVTIIVNAREHTINSNELTFEQLVSLAFPEPLAAPNVLFTITYRCGHGDKPEGSLLPGQRVRVKDGMIVNVTDTGNA